MFDDIDWEKAFVISVMVAFVVLVLIAYPDTAKKKPADVVVMNWVQDNNSTSPLVVSELVVPPLPVPVVARPVVVAAPLLLPVCLHGFLVNDSMNRTICVRSRSGEELKNYTAYILNETLYNLSNGLPNARNITPVRYLYYRENCTNVSSDYVWNGVDWIVNSSHPLSCPEIRSWTFNYR
jgi:hypothetical protein